MDPLFVMLLIGGIIVYYYIRDLFGKHAQHKRVIAAKCSCGSCHAKKIGGKKH